MGEGSALNVDDGYHQGGRNPSRRSPRLIAFQRLTPTAQQSQSTPKRRNMGYGA